LFLGNVYGKLGKMTSGLSYSVRNGDKWSFPTQIKLKNDYNLSAKGTFDLSHSRKRLLISEEKVDSHGKRDLYVAFRSPGKNPYAKAEAINLGPDINTAGDEASPFLSEDGTILFFSSDGHKGYGMSDMFMSRRLDDSWTSWSKPENLGPRINTPFDDGQFVFTPHARFAYYSRGISPTRSDIYRIEVTYLFKPEKAVIAERSSNEIGQTHVVKNVFDDNKDAVKDQATAELDAIVDYLQRNKTMTVMVSTHSNLHKSRKESHTLSNHRITSMENYLTSKGIDKSRIHFRSYGQDVLMNTKSPELKQQIPGQVEFSFVNYGR
jgi:OOP family OmpA-OmpF porin